jgi:hypothetical protein
LKQLPAPDALVLWPNSLDNGNMATRKAATARRNLDFFLVPAHKISASRTFQRRKFLWRVKISSARVQLGSCTLEGDAETRCSLPRATRVIFPPSTEPEPADNFRALRAPRLGEDPGLTVVAQPWGSRI